MSELSVSGSKLTGTPRKAQDKPVIKTPSGGARKKSGMKKKEKSTGQSTARFVQFCCSQNVMEGIC